ncbi:MAG: transglycosylase domain-containing protein [Akkermansiaceae bacterium]|nr:transglycosylase domain-containing protein [Akkermansiaceae bacterium]
MPKRNPEPPNSRKNAKPPRRRPGAVTVLLFWPFLLLNLVTRPFAPVARFLLRLVGYPVVAALGAGLLVACVYGARARHYDLGKLREMPERSIVLDRMGGEIGRIHGERREIVPLSQVSEYFRKAIIAREDERFALHPGMDPIGMVRALQANLRGKREGASTITQQLASDVFRLKEGEQRGAILRQLDRKFLEIAIAVRIEMALGKDQILEAYLNQINWGRQIRGIAEASRVYFERHPSELTLAEGAMLAGIVRGPDAFNPFRTLEGAVRERNTTLDRMVAAQVITREEAEAAKQEPVELRPHWRREVRESYAMDAIRRDLEIILEKENILMGGLTIHTTIDSRIQDKAEEALEKKMREIERVPGYPHQTRTAWRALQEGGRGTPDYLQGAAVVVENRTGAVLAVVGGRDANESKFNRALQRPGRQIGSLFKPFVYLAAFDQGMRPETRISDGPIQPGEIRGAGRWRPRNSDGVFGGLQPASYGLIRSRNTMSVRVGNFAGIDEVADVAGSVGLGGGLPRSPVAFLGSFEATPWQIASAYTVFPNNGVCYRPFLISEIRDRQGNVLYRSLPLDLPATRVGAAWEVARVLTQVTTRGTAASVSRLGFDKPCGGKTGTTNDFKDAWFAGFTSSLSCAVWVGLDRPRKTLQGGYGATFALPVWVDIMKAADRLGYRAGQLSTPAQLVECEVCSLSGRRATDGCREAGTAYWDKAPADTLMPATDLCPIHPARAVVVGDDGEPEVAAVPRAVPVDDGETPARPAPVARATPAREHLAPPPRAVPVDGEDYEPIPRAVEVDEDEPYYGAAEPPPPRAIPVDE